MELSASVVLRQGLVGKSAVIAKVRVIKNKYSKSTLAFWRECAFFVAFNTECDI